jgi:two-component system LytT family response regulator
MKLKIAIAEDSQENVDTLRILLEEIDYEIEIVGIAKTLVETDVLFRTARFDLAFLDIQFKRGTVFEVLDRLIRENIQLPEIVFVTAHGSFEYATRAISYACLDFITKPIDPHQLKEVIKISFRKRESLVEQQKQLKLLLELLEGDIDSPETVAIVLPKRRIEYVRLNELLYITADSNTAIFHLESKKLHSTRHLGYYIELFQDNPSIIQINRSCIVNIMNLKRYNPSSRELTLTNGEKLTASHRMSKNLLSALKSGSDDTVLSGIEKLKRFLRK